MAVTQLTVSVETSIDNFLSLVQSIVTDVKAGKNAAEVVTDAVPALVKALGTVGDLSADVADKKDLVMTVAVRLAQVVQAFV